MALDPFSQLGVKVRLQHFSWRLPFPLCFFVFFSKVRDVLGHQKMEYAHALLPTLVFFFSPFLSTNDEPSYIFFLFNTSIPSTPLAPHNRHSRKKMQEVELLNDMLFEGGVLDGFCWHLGETVFFWGKGGGFKFPQGQRRTWEWCLLVKE